MTIAATTQPAAPLPESEPGLFTMVAMCKSITATRKVKRMEAETFMNDQKTLV